MRGICQMEGETLKMSNLSLELGGSEYRTCLLSNDPNRLGCKMVRFSNGQPFFAKPTKWPPSCFIISYELVWYLNVQSSTSYIVHRATVLKPDAKLSSFMFLVFKCPVLRSPLYAVYINNASKEMACKCMSWVKLSIH